MFNPVDKGDVMRIMSNRFLVPALAVIAIILSGVATIRATTAHNAVKAPPTAVAVIDWLGVTDTLNEWKDIKVKSEQEFGFFKEEADAKQLEMEALQDELTLLNGTPQFDQKIREFTRMQVEFEAWGNFMQQDLARQELLSQLKIYQKINDAVAKVSERDGYAIVLWNDSERKAIDLNKLQESATMISSRQVFYAETDTVDITGAVVQLMNIEYQAGSTP